MAVSGRGMVGADVARLATALDWVKNGSPGSSLPQFRLIELMFRLATLGGLSLGNSEAADVAIPRRRLALLALLAVAGDRGLSRDKLVAYFWPDSSAEYARHSLEQLLYSLRHQLHHGLFRGTDPMSL